MAGCLAGGAGWPGAVAVSGGGDSIALMLLLRDWAEGASRPPPVVISVDHGLTGHGSKAAAEAVARARKMGLEAHLLFWRKPKPGADIEAAARVARYQLMGTWCATHELRGLYVAHTLEDQAETFLLRLARGSGLDGLAAMRAVSSYPLAGFEALAVVRPLLTVKRPALREFLVGRGMEWVDDPMNEDARFARVRIRKAWPALEEIGLSPARVAAASNHLGRARNALEDATAAFLGQSCHATPDRIILDGARLTCIPEEIALRALAAALSRLSHASYRPRFERLGALFEAIKTGTLEGARTLHGCRIAAAGKNESVFGPQTLIITREKPRQRKTAGNRGVAAQRQIS